MNAEMSRSTAAGRMVRTAAIGLAVAWMAGSSCVYSLTAGSFPDHIKTVAIIPFDNQTTRFELTQEIHERLLRELPGALGVRNGGAELADAVVRGEITGYDVQAPLFRPGAQGDRAEVLQREVTIRIRVEIVDQIEELVLWDDAGLFAQGQYLEASETEEEGRAEAIELLVQKIIDGAQSNW